MNLSKVGIPAYPKEVEVWWREQAACAWPEEGEAKTSGRLRGEIVRQSDLFNKERDFSPRSYGSRDASLLAYGNFFFPRTWTQLAHVLGEMFHFRNWAPPRKGPLRLLDLGCGTGAAGLSALRFLRAENIPNPLKIRAVDYSGKSLDYLRRLHADLSPLWPDSTLKTERRDLREELDLRPKDRHDLVLLSSSFNEFVPPEDSETNAATDTLASLGRLLKPGGLLLILEPALRATAERLHLAAAQVAATTELHLHAPYFNGLPCPMALEGCKHHSHEVRPWKAPATAQTLNAPLGLNLRDLKFSFVALSLKAPETFPPGTLRLVSPISKKKGHYRFVGIDANGKEYACEIQTRDLAPQGRKTLERLNRGDVIRLKNPQAIGQENRLRLSSLENLEPLFCPTLVQEG